MRTAGILVVQDSNYSHSVGSLSNGVERPFSNRNLTLLDLLGDSVLDRVIARLHRYGIHPVTVVSDIDLAHTPELNWDASTATLEYNPSGELSSSLERVFLELSKQDVQAAVFIQLSAYAEIDYLDLLRFHREHGRPSTSVHDAEGQLHTSVLDLKQQVECAELLRSSWNGNFRDRSRRSAARYIFTGYVNRLETPYDFRRLAKDALSKLCELRPVGREVRPGVWLGQGARIDRRARVLSPAYIGAHSKIRTAALITRASSVERNCQVDCGTVIDDANVLPFSYLGPGLEVAHSLVDRSRLLNLARNVELQIGDPRLLGRLPTPNPVLRIRDKVLDRILSGVSDDLFAPTDSPEAASLHTAGEIVP